MTRTRSNPGRVPVTRAPLFDRFDIADAAAVEERYARIGSEILREMTVDASALPPFRVWDRPSLAPLARYAGRFCRRTLAARLVLSPIGTARHEAPYTLRTTTRLVRPEFAVPPGTPAALVRAATLKDLTAKQRRSGHTYVVVEAGGLSQWGQTRVAYEKAARAIEAYAAGTAHRLADREAAAGALVANLGKGDAASAPVHAELARHRRALDAARHEVMTGIDNGPITTGHAWTAINAMGDAAKALHLALYAAGILKLGLLVNATTTPYQHLREGADSVRGITGGPIPRARKATP